MFSQSSQERDHRNTRLSTNSRQLCHLGTTLSLIFFPNAHRSYETCYIRKI